MSSEAGEPGGPVPRPLQTLDLNLLLPLEALLRRRSVSRAADELHLGQPGVSESLARLRRHFDDELLKREGHELVLTPFASGLVPQVERAVRAVHAVFDGNAVFDQASSSREFVIAAADVWVRVVGPPLWQAIHRQAPGVRLDFRALDPAVFRDPLSAMRSVDFVICPHGLLPGMRGHGPAHPGQPGSAPPADHGAVVAPAVRHRPRPPVAAPRAGQALSAGLIPAIGFC